MKLSSKRFRLIYHRQTFDECENFSSPHHRALCVSASSLTGRSAILPFSRYVSLHHVINAELHESERESSKLFIRNYILIKRGRRKRNKFVPFTRSHNLPSQKMPRIECFRVCALRIFVCTHVGINLPRFVVKHVV
jgi:hypothetical protein